MPSISETVTETAVFTGIPIRFAVGVLALTTALMTDAATTAQAVKVAEFAVFTDLATGQNVATPPEHGAFTDVATAHFAHRVLVIERLTSQDQSLVSLGATVAESGAFTGVAKTAQGTTVVESASASDVALPRVAYRFIAVESVSVRDSAIGFIQLTARDTAAFSDTARPAIGARIAAYDTAQFSDRATPLLRAREMAHDTASVADNATVRFAYRVMASSSVVVIDNALLPLSGIAWTASTDSFAMSRYTNFKFNSAARIGNQLVAAGDGGLYVIGDFDDNGAPIAASLTTGLTDVGDPQQKRVREIYLGYESSGAMGVDVAVTMSGTEQTFGYTFPAKTAADPTANRQKVGRGLKSRFWRFIIHNVTGARFRVTETRVDVEQTSRKI